MIQILNPVEEPKPTQAPAQPPVTPPSHGVELVEDLCPCGDPCTGPGLAYCMECGGALGWLLVEPIEADNYAPLHPEDDLPDGPQGSLLLREGARIGVRISNPGSGPVTVRSDLLIREPSTSPPCLSLELVLSDGTVTPLGRGSKMIIEPKDAAEVRGVFDLSAWEGD